MILVSVLLESLQFHSQTFYPSHCHFIYIDIYTNHCDFTHRILYKSLLFYLWTSDQTIGLDFHIKLSLINFVLTLTCPDNKPLDGRSLSYPKEKQMQRSNRMLELCPQYNLCIGVGGFQRAFRWPRQSCDRPWQDPLDFGIPLTKCLGDRTRENNTQRALAP